ncbi:MAG TPA: glycerophosphodiester phosphodiesterase family protein [Clostridia bacterium]|nr:glycerophosphodiester phosphodiesterase family protein [Clostridia bacterium]
MKRIIKKSLVISLAAVTLVAAILIGTFITLRDTKIQPVLALDVSSAGIDVSQVPVRLIAQRGLSGLAPENTRLAIERAGRESFTAVTFDIRETLDGVFVLMRESRVNTMTDGRGKIKSYTYFELLNFTVDNGANIEEYTDVKIAELEEILDLCAQFGMRPYINIKQSTTDGIAKLAAILTQRLDTQNCAVLSCDKEVLLSFKDIAPSTELWLLAPKLTQRNMEWLEENEWAYVAFDAQEKDSTEENIKTLVQAGKRLACIDVEDPQTIKRMYEIGVMDFHTDRILPK